MSYPHVQGQEPSRHTDIRYPIFHPPRDKAPSTSGRNKHSQNSTGLYRRTFEVCVCVYVLMVTVIY